MPGLSDDIGRLVPHLRRFARALVRAHSLQAADDIVQETVVLAMRTEGVGRGPALTIWCYAALLRVHRIRQKQVLWERQGGAQAVECDSEGGLPPIAGPATFLSKDIARLDSLPLPHREVLLLTVLAGLCYSQVAEVLSLPQETVIARLTEARDRLDKAESGTAIPQDAPRAELSVKSRPVTHLRVVK